MSETSVNNKTQALTFDEFKRSVISDYEVAFLSNHLIVLINYKSLIKDKSIRIIEPERELLHLAIDKIAKDTDHQVESIYNVKYLLGTAVAARLHENKALNNYKNLDLTGNDVVFWTVAKKELPVKHIIDTINAANKMKLPLAFIMVEDGDELIEGDNKISRYYANRLLNDIEVCNIFQCNATDYPGLCKNFVEGTAICRKEQIPVIFHIKHPVLCGNEELSEAVLQFRNWILRSNIMSQEDLEKRERVIKEKAGQIKKKVAKECLKLSLKLI